MSCFSCCFPSSSAQVSVQATPLLSIQNPSKQVPSIYPDLTTEDKINGFVNGSRQLHYGATPTSKLPQAVRAPVKEFLRNELKTGVNACDH